MKYTALLATGNYHGVVGFAKAKAPNAKVAIQRVSSLSKFRHHLYVMN